MMKVFKILVVLFVLGIVAYLFLTIQLGPYGEGATVYIPKGENVGQIANRLKEGGVLRNAWSFKLLVRIKGVGKKLQVGEYKFGPKLTTREVLEKILKGDRVVHRLIIPEGSTLAQIAELIDKTGIAPTGQVQAALADPQYLRLLGFPAKSLEGYLYPATYDYDMGTTPQTLVPQMIQAFLNNFDENLRKRAQQGGWTIPQVVTLASVIEKETGQGAERPLIASVFHNRLKIGMPLQSDPTVIYGLKNFDGNLRRRDLRDPHPYNTYVHPGLPPGPIASPGKAALQAVLFPATTPYFFFVSKGDGTHQFSASLVEHNAAVRKYQLGKGPETRPAMPETMEASPSPR